MADWADEKAKEIVYSFLGAPSPGMYQLKETIAAALRNTAVDIANSKVSECLDIIMLYRTSLKDQIHTGYGEAYGTNEATQSVLSEIIATIRARQQ